MWRACNSLPRTGLPELFRTQVEYETYVVDLGKSIRSTDDPRFLGLLIRLSLAGTTEGTMC